MVILEGRAPFYPGTNQGLFIGIVTSTEALNFNFRLRGKSHVARVHLLDPELNHPTHCGHHSGQASLSLTPLPLLTIPGDRLHLHQLLVTLAKVRGRFPEFTHIHHGGGREKWGVNNKRSWRFEAAHWKRMMPRLKGQGPPGWGSSQ